MKNMKWGNKRCLKVLKTGELSFDRKAKKVS